MGKRMDNIAPWSIELQKRRKSIGSQPASRAQRGDAKTSGLTRAHVRTTHEDPNPVRLFSGNYRSKQFECSNLQ